MGLILNTKAVFIKKVNIPENLDLRWPFPNFFSPQISFSFPFCRSFYDLSLPFALHILSYRRKMLDAIVLVLFMGKAWKWVLDQLLV